MLGRSADTLLTAILSGQDQQNLKAPRKGAATPSSPMTLTRRLFALSAIAALASCGDRSETVSASSRRVMDIPLHPNETPELRALINKYADIHDIPVSLLHRVIIRESTHNPAARNGPYMGLMQIHPNTARGMGYQGSPEGLLDAETNLRYAGKYLRGAWLVSGGDEEAAVMWYARGYYYEAKRQGLLEETGLR
jgi:soluble lytic murein transglycosylase-like protein